MKSTPLTPFPHPLHWVGEAIRMGETVCRGQTFGTQVALVQEAVGICFHIHDPVVLDGDQKPAAAVVHS